MLFTHETKQFGTIHTQAMINSFIPFEVIMRETTEGGDALSDFEGYDPSMGASCQELTEVCDDIYDTLLLHALKTYPNKPILEEIKKWVAYKMNLS